MLTSFFNCFKVEELRNRMFFTLCVIFVARMGANIPLPGLDPVPLQNFYADRMASGGNALLGLYNMFTGGALLNGGLFAIGIMPYITASIIMQLMGAVMPSLVRLQKEGDVGRQKLAQYTRYLTIGICFIQGLLLIRALQTNPGMLVGGDFSIDLYGPIVIANPFWFTISSTLFLTAGTVILMWLGEQISEKGIGNGISILITVGIISDLPKAISSAFQLFMAPVGSEAQLNGLQGISMLVILFAVIMGIIMITQGQRKIPVQYAKRVVGRNIYGGQSSFMPLKVNYSGVMPVIFASALLVFPMQISSQIGAATGLKFFSNFARVLEKGTWHYYAVFSFLILAFSYLWLSIMFKPVQIADDLKKQGGYVPGVRPGSPTAAFLDFVMTRLTLAGSVFLTAIAVFPDLFYFLYKIPYQIAMFFGGTGMLITVGVVLDSVRQIETVLLQKNYDGFLKKGRLSSKSGLLLQEGVSGAASLGGSWRIYAYLAILLFIIGLILGVSRGFSV